jgi:hypothetical protein
VSVITIETLKTPFIVKTGFKIKLFIEDEYRRKVSVPMPVNETEVGLSSKLLI